LLYSDVTGRIAKKPIVHAVKLSNGKYPCLKLNTEDRVQACLKVLIVGYQYQLMREPFPSRGKMPA
jgi:hypothetical protein